jgi:hypothetical protein
MLEGRIATEDSPLPSTTAAISFLSAHHQTLKEDDDIQEQLAGHLAQVRAHLADSAFWYASYLELLEPTQSLP